MGHVNCQPFLAVKEINRHVRPRTRGHSHFR